MDQGSVASESKGGGLSPDQYAKIIDERVKRIPDPRPPSCKSITRAIDGRKVSIIIDFFDYEFYDLKTTMGSVWERTPKELIQEVIMVDDGSTLNYIRDESVQLSKSMNIKLLRNERRQGPTKSRLRALEEATADILIFMDTRVIVNAGWLEPLVDMLGPNSEGIAVPHFDNIQDPVSYDYVPTDHALIASMTWTFSIKMKTLHGSRHERHDTERVDSPALRGNILGIRKDYFRKIGGYDLMNDAIGENLELGLRTWLCGGVVKVQPCSRVGILNLMDTLKVQNKETIRHIGILWLDEHQEFVYHNTDIDNKFTEQETKAAFDRKSHLGSLGLRCQNIRWFTQNIAPDMYSPSTTAMKFGLFRCKTGACAKAAKDTRLELGNCNPEKNNLYIPEMIFELNNNRQILVGGQCLHVKDSAYVVTQTCEPGNDRQLFELKKDGKVYNDWSKYCLMHVTDPDRKVQEHRQIVMVQDCSKLEQSADQFIRWEFISP